MAASIDLLNIAFRREPDLSKAELCRRIETDRTAINVAIKRNHLSPILAGQLAMYLGEPISKWMAIAALEKAPPDANTRILQKLMQKL